MTIKLLYVFVFSLTLFANAQDKNIFDIARKGTLTEVESIYKSSPKLINSVDDKKHSPLIIACYRANVDVALFLIEKVSDINYISGDGTALMAAVMSGNIQIIDKLILYRANLNLADAHGKTALIYAAFFNKNEIVKSLIKSGTDLSHKDSDGKTALDFANFNKNTELIILLDN